MLLGVGMLILSTQRQLFALHPSRNYYHWLIIDESIRNSSLPKVYAGDHLYFPNKKDQGNEAAYLWINNTVLRRTYNGFSNDISIISTEELIGLQHFILIHDWTREECIKRIRNFGKTNIKESSLLRFSDDVSFQSLPINSYSPINATFIQRK